MGYCIYQGDHGTYNSMSDVCQKTGGLHFIGVEEMNGGVPVTPENGAPMYVTSGTASTLAISATPKDTGMDNFFQAICILTFAIGVLALCIGAYAGVKWILDLGVRVSKLEEPKK